MFHFALRTAPRGWLVPGLLLSIFALGPAPAEAAPRGRARLGWSSEPRWHLPEQRSPECPHGYARGGALTSVRKVRCREAGPQPATVPPSVPTQRPLQPSRPTPAPAPGVARPSTPLPAPGRGSVPTIAPGPDATALMTMDTRRCHDHLRAHGVAFTVVPKRQAPDVEIPVRLAGPVAGVTFTIPWSKDMTRDVHAIWDCRLVAAVVPMAAFLRDHGVTEVHYFSVLRPGKVTSGKPRSQHNVGLALDLRALRGPSLALATVEQTYTRGRLRTCPAGSGRDSRPGAPVATGAAPSDIFFTLVCQAYTRGLFHTILTPDHDRAHYNHLHLDLKAGKRSPADPYLSHNDWPQIDARPPVTVDLGQRAADPNADPRARVDDGAVAGKPLHSAPTFSPPRLPDAKSAPRQPRARRSPQA